MNTPPGAIVTGQVTRRDWLQTQTEILRSINNTTYATDVALATLIATVNGSDDFLSLHTVREVLQAAENAAEPLREAQDYLLDIFTYNPKPDEIDPHTSLVCDMDAARTFHAYALTVGTNLSAATQLLREAVRYQ
jgi:hypothetical protein